MREGSFNGLKKLLQRCGLVQYGEPRTNSPISTVDPAAVGQCCKWAVRSTVNVRGGWIYLGPHGCSAKNARALRQRQEIISCRCAIFNTGVICVSLWRAAIFAAPEQVDFTLGLVRRPSDSRVRLARGSAGLAFSLYFLSFQAFRKKCNIWRT